MATAYFEDRLDLRRHILRSPFRNRKTMQTARLGIVQEDIVNKHPAFDYYRWTDGVSFEFMHIHCGEHGRMELVPRANYHGDLRAWYAVGRHPKFSIIAAMKKVGFRYTERSPWRFARQDPDDDTNELRKALEVCRDEKHFLKLISHIVPVWLYNQGRRYRVTQSFKQKFRSSTFTAQDFFAEVNQELRRLMLRRGIQLADVLAKLTCIGEDAEGKLYAEPGNDRVRYLYVKCPSTGQEYLLGVPAPGTTGHWDSDARNKWIVEPVAEMTPAQARRWTFNLPAEAEFVQEA